MRMGANGTQGLSASRAAFRALVYAHFKKNRRTFPWRTRITPYRVLVSEIMLQQTQTDRVAKKFPEFIKAFPTFSALAAAQTRDVLALWQGMGYNRRALALKTIAQTVVKKYGGRLPRDPLILETFPCVGPNTAASICAFAFDVPVVFIETNIRTAYLHYFFPGKKNITDAQLLPLIERTLDRTRPRLWYSALMDYGAMLKKTHANPGRNSAHYKKQSQFKGSNRQVRSRMLKHALSCGSITAASAATMLGNNDPRIAGNLEALTREGFLTKKAGRFYPA